MKKLLIPTISALFLAACGATEAPTEVNSDTVLDDQLFQEATTANNLAKCDEIIAAAKKDECKMVVNSFLITGEAVAKLDASLCEDITDERYKENCENRVDDNVKEKEDEENRKKTEMQEDEKTLTIEEEALKLKDANLCNQIKDQNEVYSCKYNVLASLAIEKHDSGICDGIGQPAAIQQCKNDTALND